jgi:hypothetical protein
MEYPIGIMVKFLIHICLIFFLSNCSSLQKHTSNFEVSNYIMGHVSEVPINIPNDDIVINLTNAASVEKILLYFKVDNQQMLTHLCLQPLTVTIRGSNT